MSADAEILSYKRNWLNRWQEERGGKLVQALPPDQKPPPRLPDPKVATAPAPRPPKPDPLDKMVDDLHRVSNSFSRFKTWLDTPDPPRRVLAPAPATKIAPPFDVQDIPGAMENLKLPVSAKLLRKWFASPLNYPLDSFGKIKGVQQDCKPYASPFIDTVTIKMDWVQSFSRGKNSYGALIKEDFLFDPKARREISKLVQPYCDRRYIDAWELCDGNIDTIHRRFQFQKMDVATSALAKITSWIDVTFEGLAVDDLMGALGGFSFYAAIGEAEISVRPFSCRQVISVNKIYIYVRNPYSFFDDDPVNASQYLGHWNKKGVRLVPVYQVAYQEKLENSWMYHAFKNSESGFYYPVHNVDLRAWQLKHKQGGDMILYSDILNYRPRCVFSMGM